MTSKLYCCFKFDLKLKLHMFKTMNLLPFVYCVMQQTVKFYKVVFYKLELVKNLPWICDKEIMLFNLQGVVNGSLQVMHITVLYCGDLILSDSLCLLLLLLVNFFFFFNSGAEAPASGANPSSADAFPEQPAVRWYILPYMCMCVNMYMFIQIQKCG